MMTAWIKVNGRLRKVEWLEMPSNGLNGPTEFRVDGSRVMADAFKLQPGVISLLVEGHQYRCVRDGDAVIVGGGRHEFALADPRSLKTRRGAGSGVDGPRPVKAPMPGRVVRALVAVGDEVAEGQGVIVIEAMKMQNELRSPKPGRVTKIATDVGDVVAAGDVLVVVE